MWASPEADSLNNAKWVNRGLSSVKVAGGAAITAEKLLVGPPGIIRGQLVDAETGKPISLTGPSPSVRIQLELLGGPQQMEQLSQATPCTADGRFEARTLPGAVGLYVFVYDGDETNPGAALYRSDDEFSSGPTYETEFGKTVEARVPVRAAKDLDASREAQAKAWKMQNEGKNVEAIAAFTDAIKQFPKDAEPLRSRAHLHHTLGDDVAAVADYDAALKLKPNDVGTMLQLAGLLATSSIDAVRDGQRAVELAEAAINTLRATNRAHDPGALTYLAAAYAEAGAFDKAVATQQEAVDRAPAEDKEALQKRLELYKSGKPYRRTAAPASAQQTSNAPTSAGQVTVSLTAPAKPNAVKPEFVRIVIGPGGAMTFEGEKTTEEELPKLLEKVPDRERTVLEIAIASDDMTVREANNVQGVVFRLAREFKFLYGSYVGTHPLGSKGGEQPPK